MILCMFCTIVDKEICSFKISNSNFINTVNESEEPVLSVYIQLPQVYIRHSNKKIPNTSSINQQL